MPQRDSWKSLSIGLLSLGAVVGAALLILTYARVGTLRGDKFELVVSTGAARGVIPGSDVWLDGQKVGTVKAVGFQPPSASRDERLVLTLELLSKIRDHIRRDSRVQIRAGTSIIGDQVVHISSGTAKQPTVDPGDTLRALAQADAETMASDFALASREFPGILENVKLISQQMKSTETTLGALGVEGMSSVDRLGTRAKRLMSRLSSSQGSLGLARNGLGELRARAANAMQQVDSVRALLASDDHSLGRFRRDSTIVVAISRLRAELAEVQRLASEPYGTLGRLRADSAITRAVNRDLMALDSLMADMKKRPLRYIAF